MDTASTLKVVAEYGDSGLSCLPIIAGTKRPVPNSWRGSQHSKEDEEKLTSMFRKHQGEIAIVCGSPSGNLGVIDVEDRKSFLYMAREFEDLNGPTWMVETARGGHIYFRSKKSVAGHKFDSEKFEIRGQGQYVLAPPSAHPSGFSYEFKNKPSEIAFIDKLPFCDLEYTGIKAQLPQREMRYLSREECLRVFEAKHRNRGRYASDSEFDMAIITTLVNRGVNFESVLDAFQHSSLRTHFSKCIAAQQMVKAIKALEASYNKALCLPHKEVVRLIQQRALALRNYINSQPWSFKNRDKAVLLAHIARYEYCKKEPWHLSVRDAAEIASVSRETVSASNKRLRDAGQLKISCCSDWERAAAFAFGEKLIESFEDYSRSPIVLLSSFEGIAKLQDCSVSITPTLHCSVPDTGSNTATATLLGNGPMSHA